MGGIRYQWTDLVKSPNLASVTIWLQIRGQVPNLACATDHHRRDDPMVDDRLAVPQHKLQGTKLSCYHWSSARPSLHTRMHTTFTPTYSYVDEDWR